MKNIETLQNTCIVNWSSNEPLFCVQLHLEYFLNKVLGLSQFDIEILTSWIRAYLAVRDISYCIDALESLSTKVQILEVNLCILENDTFFFHLLDSRNLLLHCSIGLLLKREILHVAIYEERMVESRCYRSIDMAVQSICTTLVKPTNKYQMTLEAETMKSTHTPG